MILNERKLVYSTKLKHIYDFHIYIICISYTRIFIHSTTQNMQGDSQKLMLELSGPPCVEKKKE